jgi:hypothetical protein
MLRKQEELLAELDATLDQLIQNASVFSESDLRLLEPVEINSLHKTQESLLARFASTQERMKESSKEKSYEKIQEKLEQLGRLNASLINSFSKQFQPRVGRNRKRSKFGQFAHR